MNFIWEWLLAYYKMSHQVCSKSEHLDLFSLVLFLSRLQSQTIFSSVTEDRPLEIFALLLNNLRETLRQVFLKVKMKSSYLKAGSFIFFTGHSSVSLNFKNIFHLWLNRAPFLSFKQEINCTEMCGVVFVSQWFSDTFSIKVRGTLLWEQWAGVSGEVLELQSIMVPAVPLRHPSCDAFCLHLDHERDGL